MNRYTVIKLLCHTRITYKLNRQWKFIHIKIFNTPLSTTRQSLTGSLFDTWLGVHVKVTLAKIPYHKGYSFRAESGLQMNSVQWYDGAAQQRTVECKMQVWPKHHNQVGGIRYKTIYTEYGLRVPGSKGTFPKVVQSGQAKILRLPYPDWYQYHPYQDWW